MLPNELSDRHTLQWKIETAQSSMLNETLRFAHRVSEGRDNFMTFCGMFDDNFLLKKVHSCHALVTHFPVRAGKCEVLNRNTKTKRLPNEHQEQVMHNVRSNAA